MKDLNEQGYCYLYSWLFPQLDKSIFTANLSTEANFVVALAMH